MLFCTDHETLSITSDTDKTKKETETAEQARHREEEKKPNSYEYTLHVFCIYISY